MTSVTGQTDAETSPSPDQATLLAMKRNLLAAERTLMAWIRTSLSMIGFGFTVAKLFQSLAEQQMFLRGPTGITWTPRGVGTLLITFGILSLIAALVNHHREMKMLSTDGLRPQVSLAMAVGVGLAILGVMALVSVWERF